MQKVTKLLCMNRNTYAILRIRILEVRAAERENG